MGNGHVRYGSYAAAYWRRFCQGHRESLSERDEAGSHHRVAATIPAAKSSRRRDRRRCARGVAHPRGHGLCGNRGTATAGRPVCHVARPAGLRDFRDEPAVSGVAHVCVVRHSGCYGCAPRGHRSQKVCGTGSSRDAGAGWTVSAGGHIEAGLCRRLHLQAGAEGIYFRRCVEHRHQAIAEAIGRRSREGTCLQPALPHASPTGRNPSLAAGLTSLVVLFLVDRFAPRIPGALVVLVGGIAASRLLALHDQGVQIVGNIPAGIPLPGFPVLTWADWLQAAPASVGLALVLFAESIGAARTFAAKNGYDVDANQELRALGFSNAASAIFRGMQVGGGTSGTAANDANGARSQLSSIAASVTVGLT